MGDLNQYQSAEKVSIVDDDSQAVVISTSPSGSEEALVVRNIPSGTQSISFSSSLPAGTNAIGKLSANAGVTIGAVEIASAQTLSTLTTLTGSSVAHDGVDSGNPHKIGGKASSTAPTDVAAADRVDGWFDLKGRLITVAKAGTAAVTQVASSATNVTVLSSNTARVGATVQNDSTQILYLKLGTTASTTSYTCKMASGSYYEVPFGYTGIIDGIWASANGFAYVTEIS